MKNSVKSLLFLLGVFLGLAAIAAAFYTDRYPAEVDMNSLTGISPAITGEVDYDIVIYGGTASGVIASIEAARLEKTVALIEPGKWIGGMTTGGLSVTDIGNKHSVGGLTMEYYSRIGKKYGRDYPVWNFEPKVAREAMEEMLAEHDIDVFLEERLDLSDGVIKEGTNVAQIIMESGKTFTARVFIDASYEGDLMARAGVSYIVGRESAQTYEESPAGIQLPEIIEPKDTIDPYLIQGDPESGLLPGVNPDKGGVSGSADGKTQAYNYRWVLTDDPGNMIPIEKPKGYDPADFELNLRACEAGADIFGYLHIDNVIPGNKFDSDNTSPFSTDGIGMNDDYAEGDYKARERIAQAQKDYQLGLLWTLQTDKRCPKKLRDGTKKIGLAGDEFADNANWPTQFYIREGRRMISGFVMTQQACSSEKTAEDGVALGSCSMDCHAVQYCAKNGLLASEGAFYIDTPRPYPISYRAIVPKEKECSNLIVPVCMSASHVAYGSLRTEPVFMMLGQASAMIADMAIDNGGSVQSLESRTLAGKLAERGQIVSFDKARYEMIMRIDDSGAVLDRTEVLADIPVNTRVDEKIICSLRETFEPLGVTFRLDKKSKTLTAQQKEITLKMTIGESTLVKEINGIDVPTDALESPVTIDKDGVVYAPLRGIAAGLEMTSNYVESGTGCYFCLANYELTYDEMVVQINAYKAKFSPGQ